MQKLSISRVMMQIRFLPTRLQLWLVWLAVSTLMIPIILGSNPFFHALLVCQVGNLIFGTYLMLRHGLVKLLSLSHIIFWTPMLGKFGWYYQTLDTGWLLALGWLTIGSVALSLILDFRDYRDWRRGDRAPLSNLS